MKKPFGETKNFCPVALKDDEVLWPGNSEIAAKYREKVYYFSTAEARDAFLANPAQHLPIGKPFTPPALRMLLIGAKGSGKTLHGKLLARKFNVFHISFKDRLQELILHKTKKRIGPDYETPDEENLDELEKEIGQEKKEE